MIKKLFIVIMGRSYDSYFESVDDVIWAVVTLHTFALGKLDLLTVSLGKLNFSSVTDFSGGNFIVWSLAVSREQ